MKAVVLSIFLCTQLCSGKFPPYFKFGSATSSYQVEGAWNISDKTPSIWDTFCHLEDGAKCNNANGDVAGNSYHQWQEDIQAASDLGLDIYRFSISWPRILPTGLPNKISEDGVRYYNNLIDGLLEKGIEPLVTLYHWELPQNLQELGGWTNQLIVTWFADYVKVIYSLFGDRVKTWLTINEPLMMCASAYSTRGWLAPGVKDSEIGPYLCAKNTLLAHAHAWRIYDEEYKPKYHGKVSIANQIIWMEGESAQDQKLAELVFSLNVIYTYPVYSKHGGWPADIEEIIAENSRKEGYTFSRLPKLSKKEIKFIKGTYDFFGVNYYTSRLVRQARNTDNLEWPLTGSPELGAALVPHPSWRNGDLLWLFEYPKGLRRILEWIKNEFGDLEIMITEIGFGDSGQEEPDYKRLRYHKEHLEQVYLAIQSGIKVTGYLAWSLIDTIEWDSGYSTKFGLYKIDFNDPKRSRTPRASAKYYADVIKSRTLDLPIKYIPDELYS